MQFVVLIVLVLLAFAANSILGRMAISWGYMDALSFGMLRLASGATALLFLARMQGKALKQSPLKSLQGAVALTLYMVGFCLAYEELDAGLGALVLFGVVQIAMFAWGSLTGAGSGKLQICGAVMAFLGLAYAVWPDEALNVPLFSTFLMALSGIGWAAYSLLGRGAKDPLAATSLSFLWATVLMLPLLLLLQENAVITWQGIALGVLSGAVTSGLGYALWYRVLPLLQPAVAATVQLSVPVIAIAGGALLLAEPLGLRLLLGTLGVLAGIALVIWAPKPH